MLRSWKKKVSLLRFLLIILTGQCFALPDIPSLMDCEDIIFNAGFQDDSQPSNGTGGSYSGSFTRTVFAAGQNRNYYISIPPNYDPTIATPLLFSWHGAGGAGTAPAYALAHRDFWKPIADNNNFIVVAQESTGASGGWVPATDFAIHAIIMQDMYDNYNIERTRIYGHGFSAGGHVLHGLMLNTSQDYAAYIISAGVLEAYAGINAPANAARIIPLYVSIGNNDIFGPNLNNLTHTNHTIFNNAGWIDDTTYWLDEFNGGHQIDAQLPQKSWAKLCTVSKLL
ncbi:hypothetical protein MNBD_GAMMA01-687 [hydrothermal vent metagenome]|uniref:Uncharacterized protein n=1 Tax=hydrothermal vent metagenome TaxID=652676 RepID=A0A3B0WB05_9ZZZZ